MGHERMSYTMCVVSSDSTERKQNVMNINSVPCRRGTGYNA